MKYALAIFSLALLVSLSHRTEAQATRSVQIAPGQNIQSVVDANSAGTTYVLLSGVHRMQTVTPKSGDTFTAEVPGEAILNGSRVLSGWQYDGSYWYVGGQTDAQGLRHGSCENGYPRCNDSHSLFLDDQPQEHVASRTALGPNKWFFDYDADRIYVGQDPRGRVAEMSVTATAFLGGNTQNVTIENLIIEKYASQAQFGAVNGNTHTATVAVDWTIRNNIIRLNHGGGLRIAHGMTVQDNAINDNGQIGIIGIGDDVLIENNEIARNNWARYKTIWEAGGTKFVRTNRLIVRSNFVHHNEGPGLWTDIENFNTLYEENYVSDNRRGGLEHEISYDVTIRNNIFKRNTAMRGWLWDAQILINTSSGADVYGNVVEVPAAGGGNAITIVSQSRGSRYDGNNNYVHDNEITYLSGGGMSGAAIDYGDSAVRDTFYATNQFDFNTHHAASLSDSHWAWNGRYGSWSGFRSAGQEASGRADTNVIPDTTPPPPVGPTWMGNGGGGNPAPQDQAPFASNLIPGTIQAENYDIGGEGIAYHDMDSANRGGAYRSDGVDIKPNAYDGGHTIGWMQAGEWLQYTIDVAQDGRYSVEALVGTIQSDSPSFSLYVDGEFYTSGGVPNTGSWDVNEWIALPDVELQAGMHVLRISIDDQWLDIDALRFATITDVPQENPQDDVPPEIANVTAAVIDRNEALIQWQTSELADSQVEYGVTGEYGSLTSLGSTQVDSHSVQLSGLEPDTVYHYRVKSRDAAGNLAVSSDQTFRTLPNDGPPSVAYVMLTDGIALEGAKVHVTLSDGTSGVCTTDASGACVLDYQ